MLRVIFALCGVVLLAGCATEAGFKQLADSWIGSSEGDLVMKWGAPTSTYEADGSKYLTYARSRDAYVQGTPPSYNSYVIGNTVYTNPVGGTPGYSVHRECEITFKVSNGRISDYSYRGNACKS